MVCGCAQASFDTDSLLLVLERGGVQYIDARETLSENRTLPPGRYIPLIDLILRRECVNARSALYSSRGAIRTPRSYAFSQTTICPTQPPTMTTLVSPRRPVAAYARSLDYGELGVPRRRSARCLTPFLGLQEHSDRCIVQDHARRARQELGEACVRGADRYLARRKSCEYLSRGDDGGQRGRDRPAVACASNFLSFHAAFGGAST